MRLYERTLRVWAWLTGRPQGRRINNFLLSLGLRGLGVGNVGKLSGERYALSRFAGGWRERGPSAVLVDVGANEGDYSAQLRRLCPEAKIFAFEPHPATARRLKTRFGSVVDVHALAVGADVKVALLWDHINAEGTEHASLVSGVIDGLHHDTAVSSEVRQTSLDFFFRERGLAKIDFLKLDVEGYEVECLRGARELIKTGGLSVIQFEFNVMNLAARVSFEDFVALLPGYRFFRLQPNGLLEMPVHDALRCNFFGIQNILAISPSERGVIS